MLTEGGERQFGLSELRDPAEFMRPERLSALKQTRLSFARLLMDKMTREQWDISIERADLNERGVGRLVYAIETPTQRLSFAVFSHESKDGANTDRIIATDWDMWAFLCEGPAPPELMDDQFTELPHVREGRANTDILIWTRANRSGRFFGHVVDSLAEGHQPDIDALSSGGYLMRSSGYYGNGLNGTKEFKAMRGDHPLKAPYMAQMLSVYMLRVFSYDLAEHIAQARNPDAATLDEEIKRYLGTGNSSGIGIVHYVINHPQLLNAWLRGRETAVARVRSVAPTPADRDRFETVLTKARRWFDEDDSDTKEFFCSKDRIAAELTEVNDRLQTLDADGERELWAELCSWAEGELAAETQELLHSLLIDVHPEVCRGLTETLTVSERSDVVPSMSVETLRSVIDEDYAWALDIDMSRPGATRYFWYRSVDSEEPRLGIRGEHDYEEYHFPIDIANRVQQLRVDLDRTDPSTTVAGFLFEHPEHRDTVERVQTVHDLPYAEVHANPLDADFIPLTFVACLKALWGIQKAHPKSQGWVRGTFYQGAPLRSDIAAGADDYWLYPEKPAPAAHWRDD